MATVTVYLEDGNTIILTESSLDRGKTRAKQFLASRVNIVETDPTSKVFFSSEQINKIEVTEP